MINIPFDDFNDPKWGTQAPWPPPWFKGYKPGQKDAIQQIVDCYEERNADLVLLDAPTGAGKTFIAEATRRLLEVHQTCYMCSDLALMEQFVSPKKGFPYAARIMGRANYPTADYPHYFDLPSWDTRYLTCADCTRSEKESSCQHCSVPTASPYQHCNWCHGSCPYQAAKFLALNSKLSCTNSAYFLYHCNSGAEQNLSGCEFVIADECDRLESELLSYVSVEISAKRMHEMKIDLPPKVTIAESWEEWIRDEAAPAVTRKLNDLNGLTDKQSVRSRDYYTKLRDKLKSLAGEVGNENWVLDGYQRGNVIFKPVRVNEVGDGVLWKHGTRWLCMSATILSPPEFVESLGFQGNWEYVQMGSTFDPKRRPVRVAPVANMNLDNKPHAWPAMVDGIAKVMSWHPTERILIHTVSYPLAKYLEEKLSSPRVMTYSQSKERTKILKLYTQTPNAVMLAPSMDRGVDLPHDDCRVVVVAKAPWPNLGDKQIAKRRYTHGGSLWYVVTMFRTLIQQVGRAMRAEDDYCFCVGPETRVLTEDLMWIPAGKLSVGDKLLGFDESTSGHDKRRIKPATVLATGIEELPRIRIHLASGQSIDCTPGHKWLARRRGRVTWVRTDQLKVGDSVNRYLDTWDEDTSYEAGWLSAFFDSEGCLTTRTGTRNPRVTSLNASQRPGRVLNRAETYLSHLEFPIAIYGNNSTDVQTINVQGGLTSHLRLLGQIRPLRLLDKMITSGYQQELRAIEQTEVVDVEVLDDGPMVTLQSSSETYFAEGFGAHNTYILDESAAKELNRYPRLIPKWFSDAIVTTGTWAKDLRPERQVIDPALVEAK